MGNSAVVSVQKFVPASPQQIFDLLADPRQHPLIDGSGTVQQAQQDAPERLSLGATFGMDMRMGAPYPITNTVVEFDEPERIAWRHFGGHIWRYLLEPADGGTTVTEQFDYTDARSQLLLRLSGFPGRNKKAMEATLDRLADHFTVED